MMNQGYLPGYTAHISRGLQENLAGRSGGVDGKYCKYSTPCPVKKVAVLLLRGQPNWSFVWKGGGLVDVNRTIRVSALLLSLADCTTM